MDAPIRGIDMPTQAFYDLQKKARKRKKAPKKKEPEIEESALLRFGKAFMEASTNKKKKKK